MNQKKGRWTKYSEDRLMELENHILSVVQSKFRTWFVPIGSTVGQDDQIRTILVNENSKNTPLVMIHGFAAGLGFWCKNFDEIARDRPVYAIDLLGFGRSSRPTFAKDCESAEQQWINAIEEWRKEVKLDKFILLGHSFGGYLATSYAINHPDRVKHLILADPWGFSGKPADFKPSRRLKVLRALMTYFNPLSAIRAVGPFGPALVKKVRGDIAERYEDFFDNKDVITEYIYQCNSQTPSGETAFNSFIFGFAWPKNPMIDRCDKIDENLPITVLYGEHSWIDKKPGLVLQEMREGASYINIEIIPGAGHHIYSDQPEIFNKLVTGTCRIADENQDTKEMMEITVNLIKDKFDYANLSQFIDKENENKTMETQKIIDKKIEEETED